MSNQTAQTNALTSEVNASTTPAPATNVTVNGGDGSAFKRRGTPRPRTFNEAGVQTVKGGSQIGAGFFDSIQSAYTNLVNKPIALFLIIVATLGLLALNHSNLTPIDTMYNAAYSTSINEDMPYAIRSISSFWTWVLSVVVLYQDFLLPAIFFAGVYLAKPSTNNAWLCAILTLIVWLSGINHIEALCLGHLVILFTQIRDPTYKLGILLFAVVTILIGFAHMSGYVGLSNMKLVTAGNGSAGNPTNPGKPETVPSSINIIA